MRLNVKQITAEGVLHLAGFLPFIWLFWAGQQGYFSADPAKISSILPVGWLLNFACDLARLTARALR